MTVEYEDDPHVLHVYDPYDDRYFLGRFSIPFNESAFLAKCDRLRNDPTIRTVDAAYVVRGRSRSPDTVWSGYGRLLGEALLQNNIVNRIYLDPVLFYPGDHENYDADETAAPMLEFFKTSAGLRFIRLDIEDPGKTRHIDDSQPSLEGKILLALAQNGNITTFSSGIDLPLREFVQFLTSSTMAVKSCRLEKFAMCSFGDAAQLASAFGTNQSIRRLFMACIEDSGQHIELIDRIIRRLDARCISSESNGLDVKVTVELSAPTWSHRQLSHLLNITTLNRLMPSTRVLKVLVLHRIDIDEEKSALLCNGLALNRSITKLSLINCDLSDAATLEFIDFVQTKANRGNSNLKTLYFDSWNSRRGRKSHWIASILIGSALHTLELGSCRGACRFPELFEQLVANDANIRLRRLWLIDRVRGSDLVPLNQYLTQTSTLRDLRIVSTLYQRDLHSFGKTFRANGSLVRVRILDCDEDIDPLSFRSFCARNAKLAMLLRAYGCDKDDDTDLGGAVGTLPLSLAPTLFVVAKQTPRTAANIILTGLLGLSNTLAGSDKLRLRH
jgi:hypothetical protein